MRVAVALAALLAGLAAAAHLPQHSWETLPVFFHSSVMDNATWCPEDLAVITRFPVVTLEKWQGCNATAGCYVPGSGGPNPAPPGCLTQQDATLLAAAQIKAARPNASVVSWLDSLRIYSQRSLNPAIEDIEWQSCVRNALTPWLESHPEALLHNATGGLAQESYLLAHVYDHTQPAVRQLWRDACLNLTSTGLIDGCGADASQQTGAYVRGLAGNVSDAWTAAHTQAVAEATAAVSEAGGFILGKMAFQLGVSTNGVLQEGCGNDNATVNTLLAARAAAVRDGRRYVYECHFGSGGGATEDQLAAFLVAAGPDQYLGAGPWVAQHCGAAAGSWQPEFGYPLGQPLADGIYDADTATWSRAFASGTKVTFNVRTGAGSIAWASTTALIG